MSYCRMGEEGSQVYVYYTGDDKWVCSMCCLNPRSTLTFVSDKPGILLHLRDHEQHGQRVPEWVIPA